MSTRLLPSLLLSGAALLAAAASALAGPLNTQGIPAGASGLLHWDAEAARRSPIAAALEKEADDATGLNAEYAELKKLQKDLGISEKDVRDITVGAFGDLGNSESPDIVVVARGNFDPDKIFKLARQKNFKIQTIKPYHFIEVRGKDAGGDGDVLYVSPFGKRTLVALTKLSRANAVIAAYGLKSPSTPAPAALAKFNAGTTPILAGYYKNPAPKKAAAPGEESNPFIPDPATFHEFLLGAGDNGKNVFLKLAGTQGTADEARASSAKLNGLLMMGSGMSANAKKPDGSPLSAPEKARISKFFQSIKINAEGKNVSISLLYPTADLLAAIKEARKK